MKNFDFIGIKPTLNYYGNSRYQTVIGGLLSLTSFIATIGITIYFLVTFFKRKDLNIIPSTEILSTNSFPIKNLSNFTMSFLINYDTDKTEIDPSILELDLSLGSLKNENGNYIITKIPLMYSLCGKDSYYKKFDTEDDDQVSKGLVNFNCVDFNHNNYNKLIEKEEDKIPEFSIKESYGGRPRDENTFIRLTIRRCRNSTQNNNICKPSEDITRYLERTFVNIALEEDTIDHNNIDKPLKKYVSSKVYFVSTSIAREVIERYRIIEYNTDYGLVFTDNNKEEGSYLEQNENSYTGASIYNMLTILVSQSNKIDKYDRSFEKIQVVLANIGGIVKSLNVLALIVNYIFSRKSMIIELIHEYIDLNNNSKPLVNLLDLNDNQINNNNRSNINNNNSNKIILKSNISNNNINNSQTNIKDNNNDNNIDKSENNINIHNNLNSNIKLSRLNSYSKDRNNKLKISFINQICFNFYLKSNNNSNGKTYIKLEEYFNKIFSFESLIRNFFYINKKMINEVEKNVSVLDDNNNNFNLSPSKIVNKSFKMTQNIRDI